MKVLLDECVTKKLKKHLDGFEVATVREMNLSGIKNGSLLAFCVEQGFEVLLTIDKNMMFQQNMNKYEITIVVLNSKTSKIEELVEFIPSFKREINQLQK